MTEDTKVSVVIPVRNGAGSIVAAITSALEQDWPGSLEVVVADGASTDGTTGAIAAAFGGEAQVTVVPNPHGSTPAGLNAAIRATSGDVVVRCDAHSVLPANYISDAVQVLEATGADVVGGIQRAVGETAFEKAVATAMMNPLGSGGATYRSVSTPGPADTVYLGVFHRSAFERVGLFDESLARNQDYELNQRIRRDGEVYFHPDLVVDYRPRGSFSALWTQYWQYGAWKREVLRRDPADTRMRQLAAPSFVAGLLASLVLAFRGKWLLAAVVPGAYLMALSAATGKDAGKEPCPVIRLVPCVLVTMHLAWGLGFLIGRAHAGRSRVAILDPR